jgi:hypothetical protein
MSVFGMSQRIFCVLIEGVTVCLMLAHSSCFLRLILVAFLFPSNVLYNGKAPRGFPASLGVFQSSCKIYTAFPLSLNFTKISVVIVHYEPCNDMQLSFKEQKSP